MLRVEVDIFSGRPNPQWIITDADATDSLFDSVASTPGVVARPSTGFLGLGFREIRITKLEDDPVRRRGVPQEFALASVACANLEASGAIALGLVDQMARWERARLVSHDLTPLSGAIRDLISERMRSFLRNPPEVSTFAGRPYSSFRTTVEDRYTGCDYEVSQFNPGFWNAAAVRPHNNCYNFGRNWRTNTFAQPGRAHGAQTGTMACANVTAAALADGLVPANQCLEIGEWPRRRLALVVDPGVDYHWYRHQRGDFWGHKPGSTQARSTDQRNTIIRDPETCDRGGYTDFCGYFYAGRSVVIN